MKRKRYNLRHSSFRKHRKIEFNQMDIDLSKTICRSGNIFFTQRDIDSLDPQQWVTDNVIDYFIQQTCNDAEIQELEHVYVFNTQFYPLIIKDVKRAAEKIPKSEVFVFEKTLLLIPYNPGSHWSLFAVCNLPFQTPNYQSKTRTNIMHCDSIGSPDSIKYECKYIREYLQLRYGIEIERKPELSSKFGKDYKVNKKNVPETKARITKQDNTFDCGIFLIEYIEHIKRAKIKRYPFKRKRLFKREIIEARRDELQNKLKELSEQQKLFYGKKNEEELKKKKKRKKKKKKKKKVRIKKVGEVDNTKKDVLRVDEKGITSDEKNDVVMTDRNEMVPVPEQKHDENFVFPFFSNETVQRKPDFTDNIQSSLLEIMGIGRKVNNIISKQSVNNENSSGLKLPGVNEIMAGPLNDGNVLKGLNETNLEKVLNWEGDTLKTDFVPNFRDSALNFEIPNNEDEVFPPQKEIPNIKKKLKGGEQKKSLADTPVSLLQSLSNNGVILPSVVQQQNTNPTASTIEILSGEENEDEEDGEEVDIEVDDNEDDDDESGSSSEEDSDSDCVIIENNKPEKKIVEKRSYAEFIDSDDSEEEKLNDDGDYVPDFNDEKADDNQIGPIDEDDDDYEDQDVIDID